MSTTQTATAQFRELSSFPSSFLCSSGEAVWGQLHTVLEGAAATGHDGCSGPVLRPPGGTIRQSDFCYRAAVRVGTWKAAATVLTLTLTTLANVKVTRALVDGVQVGFVVHHESESPLELLKRAAAVGISHGQTHPDKDIVYINRYDWAWHHGKEEDVTNALGADPADVGEYGDALVTSYRGGRLFFMDAQGVPAFLEAMKPGKLCTTKDELEHCSAITCGAGEPFGIHVMTPDAEYELAWLVFSGNKHEKFSTSDELVGLVYDSTYSCLHNGDDELGQPSVDE